MGGIQARGLPGPQCHPGPSGCHEDSCPGVPLELWVPHSGTPRAGLAKCLAGIRTWAQSSAPPVYCHIRVTQPSLALLPEVLRPRQLSVCPHSGQERLIPALPLVQGSASCPAHHWQQLWHLRACPISPDPAATCREQVLPCLGRDSKLSKNPQGPAVPEEPSWDVSGAARTGWGCSFTRAPGFGDSGKQSQSAWGHGHGQGLTSCLLPSGASSSTVAS